MQKHLLHVFALLVVVCLAETIALGQQTHEQEPAKVEVGVQFSSLNIAKQELPFSASLDRVGSEAGFGGRFSYNLAKNVAVEAETNFFPHENFAAFHKGGRLFQGQFGIKAGKRFDKFGLFAKGRPGFLNFSNVLTQTGTQTINFNGQNFVLPVIENKRRNFFSLDVGAVVEFYPSRRILARFDVGDTMYYVGALPTFPSSFPVNVNIPPLRRLSHQFQFSSGIAIRFLNPESTDSTDTSKSHSERKFEVGGQFSSIGFSEFFHTFTPDGRNVEAIFVDTNTEAGLGGRLTYNVTPSIGLEAQMDFYPGDLGGFASGAAGGRTLQVQAGAKIGKRFEKFGLFGKARPGAISFSRTFIVDGIDPSQFIFPIRGHVGRTTHFSMDVGGVLEFYPSPRIVVRFDGGDTMIRFGERNLPFTVGSSPPTPVRAPSQITHQFQFSSGVGFRF